jgi:hypothetical protein
LGGIVKTTSEPPSFWQRLVHFPFPASEGAIVVWVGGFPCGQGGGLIEAGDGLVVGCCRGDTPI